MRGVAQKRDAAAAPVLDRRPVAQHPHAPALDLGKEHPHRRAGRGETLVQLGGIAEGIPAFLVAVGMKHGDEIVELAGAQRIQHEMHLLAGPERHVAPAILFRNFHRGQYRAIGDMAGRLRLAVADHEFADRGP